MNNQAEEEQEEQEEEQEEAEEEKKKRVSCPQPRGGQAPGCTTVWARGRGGLVMAAGAAAAAAAAACHHPRCGITSAAGDGGMRHWSTIKNVFFVFPMACWAGRAAAVHLTLWCSCSICTLMYYMYLMH